MTTPLQTAEKIGYQANGAPWGPSLLLAAIYTGMLTVILTGHGYLAGLFPLIFIPIWYTQDQSKLKYDRIETYTRTSYTVLFLVTLVIWFFTVMWLILTEPETDTWSNIASLISSFGTLTMAARFAMPWIHKSKPVIPNEK
ncbi:hypothetical protein QM007_01110 [Rothia sp. SD9660Na]|uniref:hypothetical protein n=1 Tax=Rothia sp. SD9660Na TaxID=3047030 RepID=UPI0024B88842|nr:hypothetical protein [Rothia sp. SD9660Na]WHS50616.1 hypothetical protein QM007_01110 [Rothia sp. SD9660Na]